MKSFPATQSPESPGTPDRWLVLTLAALDYFILYAHRSLIGYLKDPLKASLNLTGEEFGWLGTAFFLPYAVAQVGVGYLGDRFRRRTVLFWSLLTSVLAVTAMGFARSFAEMLACRVVLGVGQSASVPAVASAIGDSFTARTRSTAVGIYFISYNLALIAAANYSGRIADTPVWHLSLGGETVAVAGWRMALLVFGAVGALVLLLFWLFFREPPRGGCEPPDKATTEGGRDTIIGFVPALRLLLRVRTLWAIIFTFVLTSMALTAIQLWLPGYLRDRFGLSLENAGLQATLWINGATVAGLFVGGKLGDRLARRRMAGRTVVQVLGLLAIAPALVAIGTGQVLWLLAVPMMLYGFGFGLYQANLWPTTFEVVDPGLRSTAIGLLNVASGVFGLWCQPLIGHFEQRGNLGVALAALSILIVAAVGLLGYSARYFLPCDYRGPLRAQQ